MIDALVFRQWFYCLPFWFYLQPPHSTCHRTRTQRTMAFLQGGRVIYYNYKVSIIYNSFFPVYLQKSLHSHLQYLNRPQVMFFYWYTWPRGVEILRSWLYSVFFISLCWVGWYPLNWVKRVKGVKYSVQRIPTHPT